MNFKVASWFVVNKYWEMWAFFLKIKATFYVFETNKLRRTPLWRRIVQTLHMRSHFSALSLVINLFPRAAILLFSATNRELDPWRWPKESRLWEREALVSVNRPLAVRGHVTSFLWKWKLHDFAFETLLVGHLLNKIIVLWFFKPAPFA